MITIELVLLSVITGCVIVILAILIDYVSRKS